jgi:Zn-finger nucleic acid-binding protein
MENSNRKGIAINSCLYCNGKWIRFDALKGILEKEKKAPSIIDIKRAFQSQHDNNAGRCCPECDNQQLFQIIIQGVELDLCPVCYGLFFDEGELKQIFPMSENATKDTGVGASLATEGLLWVVYLFLTGGG